MSVGIGSIRGSVNPVLERENVFSVVEVEYSDGGENAFSGFEEREL